MAYCAVGLKTESGDSYTVLVEYRRVSDVPAYLYDIFDEELGYVSEVDVDSGVSPELDDEIEDKIRTEIRAQAMGLKDDE